MKNIQNKCYLFFIILIVITSIASFSINNQIGPNIQEIFLSILDKKINLKELGFFYGEISKNFLEKGELYITVNAPFVSDIKLYLGRPIFIPIFINILYKITSLEFFIILIKNVIFFSIYFFSVKIFYEKKIFNKYKFFLLLLAPFILPYNFYQALQLSPEEAYLVYLIPAIFLCVLSQTTKILYFITIIVICMFTKAPNVIIVYSIILLMFNKNFENKYNKILFTTILVFSLIWGFYGYKKSGIFTFLHKSYTINSYTGLQSHNIFFEYIYPEITIDSLVAYIPLFYSENEKNKDEKFILPLGSNPNVNLSEKKFQKKLDNEIKKFIKNDPIQYLQNKLVIIKHLIFNIKKDGIQIKGKLCQDNIDKIILRMKNDHKVYELENREKELMIKCKLNNVQEIKISYLINKIIWNFSIILAFINLIWLKKNKRISFLLLYFNFFYLSPFIYSHIYTRHQIVVFVLAYIFIIITTKFNLQGYYLKKLKK